MSRNNASTRLFTRTGDEGYTGLLGKERVPKYDLRPEALGAIDETNAFIGVCRAGPASRRTKKVLLAVQRDLWQLMGDVAVADHEQAEPLLQAGRLEWLETCIHELDRELPSLRQFVSPGENLAEANLHVARTVARRAERNVARLFHLEQDPSPLVLQYLNRLSSLLFVLALYEAYLHSRGQFRFASEIVT
ncbi:MAG: cob(I)yrinic acid a,c-diamide adenosyltransferase [Anaerolineae bacterium]